MTGLVKASFESAAHPRGRARRLRLRRGLALIALITLGASILAMAGPPATAQTEIVAPDSAAVEIVPSAQSFEGTWSALIEALDANPNIRTIAQVDHSAAAARAGLSLPPNRVVFFGNPALGTPVMQSSRSAALDLPQKIQVFETDGGQVYIAYNTTSYLASRHGANAPTLGTIAGALRGLSAAAAGIETAPAATTAAVRSGAGLSTTVSANDFETTWSRLISAIDGSPASVAFTVDHAANSGGALAPTRLAVFGNPAIGTPLMNDQPAAGIDLPLKIVVWQDADGLVNVTATEPGWIAERHGLGVSVSGASGAVGNFVRAASTAPDGSVYVPPVEPAADPASDAEGDDEVLGKTETASPPLALTGNDARLPALGALLVLIGGTLVVFSRRRPA